MALKFIYALFFKTMSQKCVMGKQENQWCREDGSISHWKIHEKCTLEQCYMT